MLRGMPNSGPQQRRLEHFYSKQAADYDRFRQRLLPGRSELIASLPIALGARVVELGAGTGSNVGLFSPMQQRECQFELIDLCRPLLAEARRAHADKPNVRLIEGDAVTWQPDQPVDLVLMSYSLSMMPAPDLVVANAMRMLRPGGLLAVVDFYLSSAKAEPGRAQHSLAERLFWSRWFAHDGVVLGAERLALVQDACRESVLSERRHRLPYLPLLRVPYFLFRGQA
ncbi:class I SAM-dependent methyltransferase [Pseudoxanthomonas sp. CAU 1598]|uniref:Class I SAM-dependent methyltransferase n=2 Tax=Pseudomarimonas arenosa TaxID=2774145 RepID=A0AAW3ZL61_9GAMM|nr:class I SAM-dependent methyltransferase [Pseudomarimonas arenosa]